MDAQMVNLLYVDGHKYLKSLYFSHVRCFFAYWSFTGDYISFGHWQINMDDD
jgi:prepilin-type processing-associated H-X9-DG protein